jgi:hypothetical protein
MMTPEQEALEVLIKYADNLTQLYGMTFDQIVEQAKSQRAATLARQQSATEAERAASIATFAVVEDVRGCY